MRFNTLKKIKKISLFISLVSVVGGSILVPVIYHKKNQDQKQVKPKTKPTKEIKINNFKNKFLKNKKEIFKIMNDIATNQTKWNHLKKIIIKNIGFEKNNFSSSKININKLNQNYKINNFEGIKNILYVIDKWETSDGKIKIFGHLKKDDLKVMIQPFLVGGFLTKKHAKIKKINLLNQNWIKSIFRVEQNIENYSIITREKIENIISLSLESQNIQDVKTKIENFKINKKEGKLSFNVDVYYLDKKHKTINVVYENLEKDITHKIKEINADFLEKKVFKFLENNQYKDYETVNFKNFENTIKKIKLIKENNINFSINNKSFDSLKGHLKFSVYFFKKGHKTHVVKMSYDSIFFKKLPQDYFQGLKRRIKSLDGVYIANGVDTWTNYKFYSTRIKIKDIKYYVGISYPGWQVKFLPFKHRSFNTFEYRLTLYKNQYKNVKMAIIYKNDYFIELEDSQWEAFSKYYELKKAYPVTNKMIKEFLASKFNPLNKLNN